MNEAAPNPYNLNKPWTKPDEVAPETADSLFRPSVNDTPLPPENKDNIPTSATQDDVFKKRYDDLKRHYDRKIDETKQEIEQLKAMVKVAQPAYVPPKSPQELASFKDTNPELYGVVETVTHEQTKDLNEQLNTLQDSNDKLRMIQAREVILKAHPDFDDLKTNDDFHSWVELQDSELQKWVYKNPYNGILAVRAIDLYKQDRGLTASIVETERVTLPDAASLVPTRSAGVNTPNEPKIWTNSEIDSMSLNQYELVQEEIALAHAEGRVRP